jgi:hypothetical protein
LSDEIRPTPIGNQDLLKSINAVLDGLPPRTATAVLQVPQDKKLRGGVYVNVGNGLSFMGWLEGDLSVKDGLGYGVAVRKSW